MDAPSKELEVLKQIQQKHARLTPEEQQLLAQIVLNLKGDIKILEACKNRLMDFFEDDLNWFFKWEVDPVKRREIRYKLLNVAGLYNVIEHSDITTMLKRVYFKIKRPISDFLPDSIFNTSFEMDAVLIKHLSPLAEFLAMVPKTVGVNYLDFISGNRELSIPPVINFVVFSPNIAVDQSEEKYLSASSENFTKTVFLSTTTSANLNRDWVGMAYDLVTQSSFIDFFHSIEKDFNINKVLRNSMVVGTRFVEHIMNWLEQDGLNPENDVLIKSLSGQNETLGHEEFIDEYLTYLETELMDYNLNLINQLNEKLGLAKDDFKIHF